MKYYFVIAILYLLSACSKKVSETTITEPPKSTMSVAFGPENYVSVTDFGAVGDGQSHPLSSRFSTLAAAQAVYPSATSLSDELDWAAAQAVIDSIAPFVWKGGTRATELSSQGGTVFFPRGTYVMNKKLRLNPNLRILGEGTGNDWTVQNAATGGAYKMGTAIKFNINNFGVYAIDTYPYNNSGVRLADALLSGNDSYNGIRTEVHNIVFENLTIAGNWNCKGLNMAGAVYSKFKNVLITGFTVGVRWSACWYSSMTDTRILSNYRGLITWMSVTDLTVSNLSINHSVDAPIYDPITSGFDAAEPGSDSWWSDARRKLPAGILNFYGNITGTKVLIENQGFAFLSYNAINVITGIYVENISNSVILSSGPDQQNEYYHFTNIGPGIGNFITCRNSRLYIRAASNNYTQSCFDRLFGDLINSSGADEFKPAIAGLKPNAIDFISPSQYLIVR